MNYSLHRLLFVLLFALTTACVASAAATEGAGSRAAAVFQKRAAKRKPARRRGEGGTAAIPAPAVPGSVRLDALAIPAGYMSGRGNPETYVGQGGAPEKCQGRAGCVQFIYRRGGLWGGIMWWPPVCGPDGEPSSWANAKYDRCGVDVGAAGGLRSVERLTFFARGERGGEVVEFKVGAGDVRPSPARSTGRVVLQTQWAKYEIDLRGVDLKGAAALFTWVAADASNADVVTFYLDEVRFEGVK